MLTGRHPQPPSTDTVSTEPQQDISLRAFDPNKADSVTLRSLGLSERVTKNILRYRSKGGKWKTAEQFKEVWGLNDSTYKALKPYIYIDTTVFYQEQLQRKLKDSLYWDSIKQEYKRKRDSVYRSIDSTYHPAHEKRDTIIELNAADTNDLQYIRGIGRYTATLIIRYRNQLGGYDHIEQLREVVDYYDNPIQGLDTLLNCFIVERDSVKKIKVNHCSVDKLNRHPYLRFNQAQAIYTYRRRHIRIKSIDELYEISELNDTDIERLAPYLSFE